MGDSAAARHEPGVGDVYAFPVERLDAFGALQVVGRDDEHGLLTATVLNWVDPDVPGDAAELVQAGRMIKDFMFHRPREITVNVSLPVPGAFVRIGSDVVTGETTSRTYTGWNFGSQIARQQWWDGLPAELTARFDAAMDDRREIRTGGLVDEKSGETYVQTVQSARKFTDAGPYGIEAQFALSSLREWPLLNEIELRSWRADLIPFLEMSPIVGRLTLERHGQRELDFGRTHLNRLSIDATGLERLVLPESLETLTLLGSIADGLRVEANGRGRWIQLEQQAGVLPRTTGLEDLRSVHLTQITEISIADVRERHPGIRELKMFGAPGVLRDVAQLAELDRLGSVFFVDLFGFGPEEFPQPEQLPALTSLTLSSTPADVAAWVRRAFKKSPRIAVDVSRPRKPEWLEENPGYPLRAWGGREGVPPVAVKKAAQAWRTARARP